MDENLWSFSLIPPEEGTGGSCTMNEDLKVLGKMH